MARGNIFTDVNLKRPTTNTFDLSHEKKMSFNMGTLTPIFISECLPSDEFRIKTSTLLRFAPMVAPVMHSINVYTHYFFIPNRILWNNFENFITGGEDGDDTSVAPYIDLDLANTDIGTIADYYGLPVGQGPPIVRINALPFAAYAKVYNEYYRDQNLIDKLDDTLTDGDNSTNFETLAQSEPLRRAWQHDYFTSALPFTQKGPEATIPLGTTAPLNYEPTTNNPQLTKLDGSPLPSGTVNMQRETIGSFNLMSDGTDLLGLDISKTHSVDLSAATAAGIIDLRRAFKLQEWLEKNARGGSRYVESTLVHFGIHTGDARLNRPEFLGGKTQPVVISEVLQTSETNESITPQGNMAGHAVSVGTNKTIKYRCKEHGFIIGLMSVMPKTAYQQGVHKMWDRADKFSYAWPSFAHIGEQPIYNYEIYLDSDPDYNGGTFGYIPRYAEYKYIPSSVHGEMRTSLDFWHLGRIFDNPPQLNADFIECNPDTRIFAVTENTENMYAHVYHSVKAKRPLPYFGNPKM